jgi:hypothetical protein
MKCVETLRMNLRYWLFYRLGDSAFWKKLLFGGLRKKQNTAQEFRHRERSVGRGSRYCSNIQLFEIRTEDGSSGLRGSARIRFLITPGTSFHKGEHAPKDHSSS